MKEHHHEDRDTTAQIDLPIPRTFRHVMASLEYFLNRCLEIGNKKKALMFFMGNKKVNLKKRILRVSIPLTPFPYSGSFVFLKFNQKPAL
jgi:hypothetical protein